ncbi:MAG: UDP-N-acetylenolpyruvoylglucosamine reductase [bacterium P3]|nr:MAG: UDP-N-acetylenolpyruvoylglucosamine reductase [bacterium P3]KWW40934.1 MAG: UDP-N-acetylenolpyruvoylglucosamine reductase [bacterium F083]
MIPNTFGLPATADRYIEIDSLAALRALFEGSQPPAPGRCYIVGAASNIIFTRHYPGTILRLTTRGVTAVPDTPDTLLVTAAAGETWDSFVRHCVARGWYGLENLVAIPGTVGAAPVQNVGAYGREAADVIHSVRVYDTCRHTLHTFSADACAFAYRDSRFKRQPGRHIVLSVTFRLSTRFAPCLHYQALRQHLNLDRPDASAATLTPGQLLDALTELRWSKLPRPEEIGSAGSFFKNPVVGEGDYLRLRAAHPDLVAYPLLPPSPPAVPSSDNTSSPSTLAPSAYKLSAGWLIEHAGWKGRTLGRCGVYERQALVLVNRGGCTGPEVQALSDAIIKDIYNKYHVTLQPEAIFL